MRCGRDAWAAAAFAALADVLGRFPTLAQSCPLVLVPGPHDLGLSDVLPRPPLPEAVLQPLQKREQRAGDLDVFHSMSKVADAKTAKEMERLL